MAAKKFNVKKEDTLKEVAEFLVNDEADELTLIVPNQSQLAESEVNFKAIKKLSEATGKKVSFESVDDRVINLAKGVNLEAFNPFFGTRKPKSWEEIEAELLANKNDWLVADATETPEVELVKRREPARASAYQEREFVRRMPKPDYVRGLKALARRWLMLLILAVVIAGGSWVALGVLPRAEIKITTQKSEWSFNNDLVAKAGGAMVPKLISLKKNAQMVFPAAGKKLVRKKAGGKIRVYNAYSSEPQTLVASTRFMAPDGKIFRLVNSVVAPKAKITDGKIEPAYMEAEVVADQSGAEYNIGPAAKFTIPGFQGTPKYTGFYGSSDVAMKGGFSGETAYPTEADTKNAKVRVVAVLKDALDSQLASQLPAGIKVPNEGAKKFEVLKFDIDSSVNDKGEFAVFAEAELSLMGFEEAKVLSLVTDKMKLELGNDFVFHNYDLKYEAIKADFVKNEMTIPVRFKGLVKRPVDVEDLYKKIEGRSERELKSIIFSLPGLENASVSLWPFYVGSIPEKREKVTITVD